uniref:Uncharacterized protein n=1 Tax=Bicosoecida sp. CB-2014 TaxID=1486930 RepID=A0A7S1CD50_9STRA|mmetsp:Transcript_20553/g.72612  ORF Transcript_20553/g.72612 Transcript_20553/m.72612 type:complete len:125 (+) Transcript_20553:184-558(+)
MLGMGIPMIAVKQKAVLAGLDPNLLDTPDAPMPAGGGGGGGPPPPAPPAAPPAPPAEPEDDGGGGGLTLADDPQYKNFFKMLKMGVPRQVVEQKMTLAGVDVAMLDRDPSSPSPNAGALAVVDD